MSPPISNTSSTLESAVTTTTSKQNRTVATLSDESTKVDLPDVSLVTIAPSTWNSVNLRELWAYRELIYFLTWRDLKVRYKQTILGAAWAVMQPLMMTVVFTIFLGMVARVPSGGVPYPVFVYAALLIWTFFSAAVSGSSSSLLANAHLITKVYFPRLSIPISSICGRLVDFSISFLILGGLLLYYRISLSWNALMLPVPVFLTMLLALGTGILLSAMNVKYRDVSVVVPVFLQFLMYVSPVIYPSALVPARWRPLYDLNPLAGILESFRTALFGGQFNWRGIAISAGAGTALLGLSLFVFRRVEKSFADVI